MRFLGGIYRNQAGSLIGDLPENWQNPLYPVGTPGTNFQEVITQPTWDTMRRLASFPYPRLPHAGVDDQQPGLMISEVPLAYTNWRAPPTIVAIANTSPDPILLPPTETVSYPVATPPVVPIPVSVPVPTPPPIYTPAPTPRPVVGRRGTSLSGIYDKGYTEFPYPNRQPSITGNVFWYTGSPQLNSGIPRFENDAQEFLRNAVMESNWDDVERWMGWAYTNGLELSNFDFGRYKYVANPTDGSKKYFPFSWTDYETFFGRFLKYASETPVDADCIRSKLSLYRKAVSSNPRNQYRLELSDCPLSQKWYQVALKFAAVIAIPVAAASIATAFAAGAAVGAGAGAGAGAAAGAAGGAAVGAGTAAAIGAGTAGVIETVVVTAVAPALGIGTGIAAAGITAGAIAAASGPPVFSAPQISVPQSTPIETVTVTATNAPALGLPAGIASAIPVAAPAIFPSSPQASTPIETVTVEGSRPVEIPLDPATAALVGGSVINATLPEIQLPQAPEAPPYDDSSILDTIKNGAKDLAEGLIGDQLMQLLAPKPPDVPMETSLPFEVPPLGADKNRGLLSSIYDLGPLLLVGFLGAAALIATAPKKRLRRKRRAKRLRLR